MGNDLAAFFRSLSAGSLGRVALTVALTTTSVYAAFRERAPGMPYAHPTVEHFSPLFVTLGAADQPDAPVRTTIDGYFFGLARRSVQAA